MSNKSILLGVHESGVTIIEMEDGQMMERKFYEGALLKCNYSLENIYVEKPSEKYQYCFDILAQYSGDECVILHAETTISDNVFTIYGITSAGVKAVTFSDGHRVVYDYPKCYIECKGNMVYVKTDESGHNSEIKAAVNGQHCHIVYKDLKA